MGFGFELMEETARFVLPCLSVTMPTLECGRQMQRKGKAERCELRKVWPLGRWKPMYLIYLSNIQNYPFIIHIIRKASTTRIIIIWILLGIILRGNSYVIFSRTRDGMLVYFMSRISHLSREREDY